jgi:hypothetical protein
VLLGLCRWRLCRLGRCWIVGGSGELLGGCDGWAGKKILTMESLMAADALENSDRLVSSLFKSAALPTLNGAQSPVPQQKVEMRSTP